VGSKLWFASGSEPTESALGLVIIMVVDIVVEMHGHRNMRGRIEDGERPQTPASEDSNGVQFSQS